MPAKLDRSAGCTLDQAQFVGALDHRLREAHRLLIADRFGMAARNGVRLLEYLFLNPYPSVNDVAKHLGVSFVAANKIVKRLVEAQMVKEITGRARNRQFMCEPYLKLFA